MKKYLSLFVVLGLAFAVNVNLVEAEDGAMKPRTEAREEMKVKREEMKVKRF